MNAILKQQQQEQFAQVVAASTGQLSEVYENLEDWGWTAEEIYAADNFLNAVGDARGDEIDGYYRLARIERRDARIVPIGNRKWFVEIRAALTKRGWSLGEVEAAWLFLQRIHFSNKEIIAKHKKIIAERNDKKRKLALSKK